MTWVLLAVFLFGALVGLAAGVLYMALAQLSARTDRGHGQ